MAEVILKNIRKAFGEVEIIKGVDLEIKDKEFAIFVGPSGCGKSTLSANDRWAGGYHLRRSYGRGGAGQRHVASRPGHGDGIPELRSLSAHDGAGQHGLRPEAGQDAQAGDRAQGAWRPPVS